MNMRILSTVTVLSLAACSPAAAPVADEATATNAIAGSGSGGTGPVPVADERPVAVVQSGKSDGSVDLTPLVYADFADKDLLGSGCTFHETGSGSVLLGVTDEGAGLVKLGSRLQRASSATPGRQAIQAGPSLAGTGFAVSVERDGGTGTQVGQSSVGWPARMTLRMSDRPARTYVGRWECGS